MVCCKLQTLSCLVQMASVRRSLFNNTERAKFLNQLVNGIKEILENPQVSHLVMHNFSSPYFVAFVQKCFVLLLQELYNLFEISHPAMKSNHRNSLGNIVFGFAYNASVQKPQMSYVCICICIHSTVLLY